MSSTIPPPSRGPGAGAGRPALGGGTGALGVANFLHSRSAEPLNAFGKKWSKSCQERSCCASACLPPCRTRAALLPRYPRAHRSVLKSCHLALPARARPQNEHLMPANRRVHAHALFLALSNPRLADHNPLVRRPIRVRRITPHHVGKRCPQKEQLETLQPVQALPAAMSVGPGFSRRHWLRPGKPRAIPAACGPYGGR